jgi:hypothetical protein
MENPHQFLLLFNVVILALFKSDPCLLGKAPFQSPLMTKKDEIF